MDNKNLLFVGGDLSGIQKFIYNITSKRAMVSLKGRSSYLKDFTKKVYNEILGIPEIKTLKSDEKKWKSTVLVASSICKCQTRKAQGML